MISMRALVAFEREGQTIKPGQRFEARAVEAAILRYHSKATFATVKKVAVPDTEAESGRRRTYKRRDLQAESSST